MKRSKTPQALLMALLFFQLKWKQQHVPSMHQRPREYKERSFQVSARLGTQISWKHTGDVEEKNTPCEKLIHRRQVTWLKEALSSFAEGTSATNRKGSGRCGQDRSAGLQHCCQAGCGCLSASLFVRVTKLCVTSYLSYLCLSPTSFCLLCLCGCMFPLLNYSPFPLLFSQLA